MQAWIQELGNPPSGKEPITNLCVWGAKNGKLEVLHEAQASAWHP